MSETYPGQNTDFFVVIDGQPKGPFKGLRSVSELNIKPDTPIWYEGISYWTPAAIDPVVRQLFDPMSEFHRATSGAPTPGPAAPVIEPAPAVAQTAPSQTVVLTAARPKSYLIGSIIIIFLMSLPCGVISLIYSWKTRNKLRDGDLEGAYRVSEISQLWIAIGIVGGLIQFVAMPFISL